MDGGGKTLGLAVGPVLFGLVLARGGFVPSGAAHRVEQPHSAPTAVVIGSGALPAVLLMLSLPPLAWYDLTEERPNRLRDAAPATPVESG